MMKKRIVSLLMALALCLSLLPVTAMAGVAKNAPMTVKETSMITSDGDTCTVTLEGTYDDTKGLDGKHSDIPCTLTFVLRGETIVSGQMYTMTDDRYTVTKPSANTAIYLNGWNGKGPKSVTSAEIVISKQGDTLQHVYASMTVLYGDDSSCDLTIAAEWTKPETHNGITFNRCPKSNKLPTEAGNYYLTTDMTLTDTWNVPTGGITNLCLNGHVIKQTAEASVITVGNGATLNLYDCPGTATHKFVVGTNGQWMLSEDAGDGTAVAELTGIPQADDVIIVSGGCITGGNAENGGGVYITEGNFNLYGGNIVGNSVYSGNMGGGVCLSDSYGNGEKTAVFNMSGTAQILGNAGGGVAVSCGVSGGKPDNIYSFNMAGGTIGYNVADSGGGVYLSKATFIMTDGSIIGNDAVGEGAEGGGVGVFAGSTFTMSGGEISGNKSAGDGGGVYVASNAGSVTLGGTAKITGNTAGSETETASNLYLDSGKTVTLGDNSAVKYPGTETPVPAPADGMLVGVTTGTALSAGNSVAITTNGTNDDVKYFFSDNAAYYVDFDTNVLKLKAPAADNHAVNVIPSANGTVSVDKREAAQNDIVTVTVTPNAGYQLKEGTLKANGGAVAIMDNKFTMPEANVTVTAEFEVKPAPPAPSGGDYTPTVTVPVAGDKDSVKISATVSGSTAKIKNVTAEQLDKVGTGKEVTVDLSSLNKSVTGVTFPKTTLENIAESEASGLEVKLPGGTTAVFDKTTVAAIAAQADGNDIQLVIDTTFKAAQVLTGAQKSAIKGMKSALVLEAYFTSNGKRISDFKGGEAELTVSYPTEKPVRVWYLTEEGALEAVPSSFNGKSASFVVKHFSNYVIEQIDGSSYASCPQDATCPIAKFIDVDTKAWYHDGVHYCVENGMMNGVGNDLFAPSATLTRGMVVTMLARLSGVDTSTDGVWYLPGQEWAVANGISDGTNMTANITREQLATMLYRYAVLKGVDTAKFTENTNTLSYDDVFTISDWASSGMHFCIAAGVVNGDNGMLYPTNTATRAEAATMFQRLGEKVLAK